MVNDNSKNLNEILSQLEDELRQVKSAKDQVESMIAADSRLSDNLERFINTADEVSQRSLAQTQETTEMLSKEIDRLSEQSEAIQKRATGVQAAIEQTANSAVDKASSDISELTQRAIADLDGGLEKARSDIESALESLKTATSDAADSHDALLEAHETASTENQRQNAETRALLEEAQKQLAEINTWIATLKEIDVVSLVNELEELKDVEAANAASMKKQLSTVTAMVAVCIVVCLATLAKLFIG